ncbi:hypothetical protein [Streptomyces sp. NPDC053427]|uniref:hypothetical protein n=1 Tax=Streptomyces sp. NPDC053427 TaxID=3365701 RepID=UPI0037D6272F
MSFREIIPAIPAHRGEPAHRGIPAEHCGRVTTSHRPGKVVVVKRAARRVIGG